MHPLAWASADFFPGAKIFQGRARTYFLPEKNTQFSKNILLLAGLGKSPPLATKV
jgi:hypothetical protein